jgi:hypothetical protein
LIYWYSSKFAETKTYRSLKRAWIGFRIAYREGDEEKMKYYVDGINKFEKQLGHAVSSFSDILQVVQKESPQKKKANS